MKKTQTKKEKVEKKETKKSIIKKTIKKEDKPAKKIVKKKIVKKDTKLLEKKQQEKQNQQIIDKILNEDENYDIEKLHNSDTYKKSIEIDRNLGNVPIVEIPKDINLSKEKTTVDPQIEVERLSKKELEIVEENNKTIEEETIIEKNDDDNKEVIEEPLQENNEDIEDKTKVEELVEKSKVEEKNEMEEIKDKKPVEENNEIIEEETLEKKPETEPIKKEKLNLDEVLNKKINLEEEPIKDITNILQQKVEEHKKEQINEEPEIADIFSDKKRIDISDLNINTDNLRYKSIESNTNYLGKVKDPKKRNMIIITAILIISIIGCIGTFTYIQYNKKLKEQNEIKKQETTLKNELNKIIDTNLLSDSINMEIKTKGDYAYIEKEIKKYYQELTDNLQTIVTITQDEDFNEISTIESIKKDDSELNNSYAIINRTKPKYKAAIDELKEICTKEKIAKILNKKLDKYYNNLYEELMYSDEEIDKLNNYQDYLKEIEEHETVIIEKTEELVKFLKEQNGKWNIEGKELKSSSDFVQSKYKQLNEQIEEEIDKVKLINIQYGYKK